MSGTLKTVIIRAIGALCIIAALLLLVLPVSVRIDGVKSKAFKEMRNESEEDFDKMCYRMIAMLDQKGFEEELEDNDLPSTRSSIKKMFKNASSVVNGMITDEFSMYALFEVMGGLTKYVEEFGKLADIKSNYLNTIVEDNGYMKLRDFEDIDDADDEIKLVATVVRVFFIVLAVICLAAVISRMFGRLAFFKYLFFILVCLIVGLLIGVTIVASSGLVDAFHLPEAFDDITVKMTAAPFIAMALALVPIVLDLIFKNKKTTE